VRCGTINLGPPSGRPTVIRDNVLTGIGYDGPPGGFVADHNLTALPTPGIANVTGAPAFVGPTTTYAGHRLQAGSPGTGDASDGLDRGIRCCSSARSVDGLG
jgi:hypothetical protein